MQNYTILLVGFGAIVLLVAWLPMVLSALPLSVPIVCLAIGWGAATLGLLPFSPAPLHSPWPAERITEATLIVSVMGACLRIDRPLSWRGWLTTWRLLGIGMILAIAVMALASRAAGFSWPAAILIAAALSPTDPVLASDVEVGPPGRGEEGEIRFGLTSEAVLNDGLAFPFASLAVALLAETKVGPLWVADHFIWQIGLAAVVGWLLGRYIFGWLTFHLPHFELSRTGDGLVGLGVAFAAYGIVLLIGGDGFVAVAAAALGLRAARPEHEFHAEMSEVMDQIQRLLMMLVLVLLGASIAAGLLSHLTWRAVALALGLIVVVRPATTWISLIGSPHPRLSRALTAFFGIRGVGSLYYLAFALASEHWVESDELGALVGLVVVASVVIHGLSATPLMRQADIYRRRVQKKAAADRGA